MTINWTALEPTFSLPAGKAFDAPWTPACADFGAATWIRITATGAWSWSAGACSRARPDGPVADIQCQLTAIMDTAPLGALIGKFGGSSAAAIPPAATVPPAPGLCADTPFLIGGSCVVQVPKDAIGPLYIALNWAGRPVSIDEALVVKVEGATPTP
jgi:hypothetical protein